MKISVVVHTYNAARLLARTLESVKDFDEVLVCDMESTDNTLDIARRYGCKIVTFPKRNYTVPEPARDFAIHSVSNQWVLAVDADEVVTPDLRQYLYKYIAAPSHADALYIHRKNMFLGRWIKASYPDSQLRFMDQTKATWPPTIHSVPVINGSIDHMPRDPRYALIHAGISVKGQITKMNDYTDNDLEKRRQPTASLLQMIFSPFWRFFKYYILEGAILEGRAGFIKACFSAITKFYYLAKVYERSTLRQDGEEEKPVTAQEEEDRAQP